MEPYETPVVKLHGSDTNPFHVAKYERPVRQDDRVCKDRDVQSFKGGEEDLVVHSTTRCI